MNNGSTQLAAMMMVKMLFEKRVEDFVDPDKEKAWLKSTFSECMEFISAGDAPMDAAAALRKTLVALNDIANMDHWNLSKFDNDELDQWRKFQINPLHGYLKAGDAVQAAIAKETLARVRKHK